MLELVDEMEVFRCSDDHKRYQREWVKNKRHRIGNNIPMEVNNKCASNLGVYKSEAIFKEFFEQIAFENVNTTGYHDGGIDFLCKNPRQEFIDKYPHLCLDKDTEYIVQLKVRCTTFDNKCDWHGWKYSIDHNSKIDIWILCAYDDLYNLTILHSWMFYKNNRVRKGRGNYKFEEFRKRSGFTVTDTHNGVKQLEQFHLKGDDIDKLNDICNNLKVDD